MMLFYSCHTVLYFKLKYRNYVLPKKLFKTANFSHQVIFKNFVAIRMFSCQFKAVMQIIFWA